MIAFLLFACSEPEETPPKPPDIVLVVVDTLRADRLGTYGYERATSPALDSLAAEGMVFDRAYSHSGWSARVTAGRAWGAMATQSFIAGLKPLW